MKLFNNKLTLSTVLLTALTGSSFAKPQQGAGQDMKDAGSATKEAAKDTGRATKKTAKKTGHAVKKPPRRLFTKARRKPEKAPTK